MVDVPPPQGYQRPATASPPKPDSPKLDSPKPDSQRESQLERQGAGKVDLSTDWRSDPDPNDSSAPNSLAGNFEDIDSLLANVGGGQPAVSGLEDPESEKQRGRKKTVGKKSAAKKTQPTQPKPTHAKANPAQRGRQGKKRAGAQRLKRSDSKLPDDPGDAAAKLKLNPVAPRQSQRPDHPGGDGQDTATGSGIPEAQWHSDATARKKRLLQRAALGVAGALLGALGVWMFFGGGFGGVGDTEVSVLPGSGDAVVDDAANKIEAGGAGGVVDGTVAGVAGAPPRKPNDINPPAVADGVVAAESPSGAAGAVTSTPTDRPETDLAAALLPDATPNPSAGQALPPKIVDTGTVEEKEARAGQSPVVPLLPSKVGAVSGSGSQDGSGSQNADAAEGSASGDLALVDGEINDENPGDLTSPFIASTENSLGELSKILQGQGTSLQQIEDIAEIQKERSLIGTPKYFIQRPGGNEVDVLRQLSAELSGWKLDKVPLIDAVKDIELLADVPITLAADIFSQGRFNLNRPVSLKVEAVSFKEALERVLVDDGLALEILSDGVVIVPQQRDDVVTHSYPQSFCTTEQSAKRLRELIVAVTGINDWDDERFELNVSTDAVTVSHLDRQHRAIAGLIEKLAAAAQYRNEAEAASIKETLRPLALSAEATLDLSPKLKSVNPYRRTMRVASLFRHLRNATDLNVVADWQHLSQSGWFPSTPLPGGIDEPTNRRLLDQLGHAMELTTVVVAPDTLMLTTFENAGRHRDVEVFSVGDVIDNKMKPVQLDQLLTETLGADQLSPPNAVVIYFAECKCLVVNAPQIIQRQLYSIVKAL